jgi:hypothetical protein
MSGIDDYVIIAFCRTNLKSDDINESFRTKFEVENNVRDLISRALNSYPPAAVYDPSSLASHLVDIFVRDGVVETEADPIAGEYFRIKFSILMVWKKTTLETSEIGRRAALIGPRFLRDVFSSYFGGKFEEIPSLSDDSSPEATRIPASDRVVTLSHNQLNDLEAASSEIIDAVSAENAIDGDSSLRQRVVGQLKAGRELIRAQTLNAYLLYSTLMTILGGLIQKYRDQAIGVAAKRLVELLIEHVFGK